MATCDQILDEARKDAVAYYGEFGSTSRAGAIGRAVNAWAEVRSDLELSAEDAERFLIAYWEAFCEEWGLDRLRSRPHRWLAEG